MGKGDKAKQKRQNVTGKAKEAAGRARSDKPLKNEGKRDQQRSQWKQVGEHLKRAFKR